MTSDFVFPTVRDRRVLALVAGPVVLPADSPDDVGRSARGCGALMSVLDGEMAVVLFGWWAVASGRWKIRRT
ncbi:hypothetical protein [Lentzea sp. NPDC092896]|uniref:hypothetical protein n=1 Tax=Lentzea sp. NPDC092896 TaxID=3364127 RepID=UPI0037F4B46F